MRNDARVAGFKSESPAGFKLECMAGFVGTRISATIVWDYESDIEFVPPVHVNAMRAALEKAGVEFIEDGVKLRKSR